MNTIETLDNRPFRHLITTIGALPTSFIDSMSYYEMLAWLCDYLQNTVIPAVDNNAEALQELQEAFVTLKEYVDNYFENLDIQTEIDNKLDEMADQGVLADIIAQYIQLQGVLAFDNIAALEAATNLANGSFAETYGFYAKGDGGGATYKIRTITNDDVIDNMFLFNIDGDPTNTLVAELMPTNDMNVLKYGIKNDGSVDETAKFQKLIDADLPIHLKDGTYLIEGTLTGDITIIGESQNSILYGGTTKHDVIDCSDPTSTNKTYLSNIAFSNATLKLYLYEGGNLVYADKSDTRNIYAENVWFDEPVVGDGATYWGLYVKTPKPADYTRYGNSGYACYPVEIVNNSGYNALMINNVCTDDAGVVQSVADNSAIGIIDKVSSSAPTIFVVQKETGRNFMGFNRSNAPYNVDGRVFEIANNGHTAIGCKVAADTDRPGWATLKLNDENPNIIFYSNRDGETTSNYGMLTFGGSSAKRNFAIYVGGTELMRITNRGFMGRAFASATIQTLPRSELIEGEQIFDTTHHKPLWYNGTVWVDGAGTTVVTPNS